MANENSLEWIEQKHGDLHHLRRKKLGQAAGSSKLGASLYELSPGKRSFPYHYHLANEEAIYVLEGSASLRLGDKTITVTAGDYIALKAGPEGAHQLVNDSDRPLRYLMISTMTEPDVTVYPDSGKIGVFAGAAPGGPKDQRKLEGYFREGDAVDYWHGEDR